MPPLTRTAILRPRTAAGTSAGSSGLTPGPPLRLQDPFDLGHRPLGVVVDHHVVVAICKTHLQLCQTLASLDLPGRLGAPFYAPSQQLLHGRRSDEDVDGVRAFAAHLLGTVDVDLHDHVVAVRPGIVQAATGGPVEVTVDGRMLQQLALGDQPLERGSVHKAVMLSIHLVVTPRTGGVRDGVPQPVIALQKFLDERVLPHPARSRDHDHQSRAHRRLPRERPAELGASSSASQKSWKSAGGGVSKLISAPLPGWRKLSLQACSKGRAGSAGWFPAGRPRPAPEGARRAPYSSSPATGCPRLARCTLTWWVRPVSRSHRTSV